MVNEQLAMSKTVIAHSNADSAMQDVVTTCMHAIDSMTSCILHFHLTQLEAINPPLNMAAIAVVTQNAAHNID